jgi:hypothetical protein
MVALRTTLGPVLLVGFSLFTPQSCFGFALVSHPVRNKLPATSTTKIFVENAMNAEKQKNLIMVVGSANQDLISNTGVLPTIGETVMGNDFAIACGGKGANQAVAAASLALAPVAMVCRVGDDIFGHNLLSNFRKLHGTGD